MRVHKITESDHFVIVASDGLFDFFSNEEAVELVHSFIFSNPSGDPAKFLLERLVAKAAARVGKLFFSLCFNFSFITKSAIFHYL